MNIQAASVRHELCKVTFTADLLVTKCPISSGLSSDCFANATLTCSKGPPPQRRSNSTDAVFMGRSAVEQLPRRCGNRGGGVGDGGWKSIVLRAWRCVCLCVCVCVSGWDFSKSVTDVRFMGKKAAVFFVLAATDRHAPPPDPPGPPVPLFRTRRFKVPVRSRAVCAGTM